MIDLLTFGAGDRLRGKARCVLSAGAPLPSRTAQRFFDCTGMHIRPLYGTTETGGISVGPEMARFPGDGYVGPAMRGVEASIRDEIANDASGRPVGRLYVRSSSMMSGYLAEDGIDNSQLDDGWFLTGDLANFDAQANIYLHGRQSEVINVGGLKVIPREVEEVIATLDGVHEVKVYAGHDRQGRQFVKAAVVATANVAPVSVQQHCERELVYYKRPHTVLMLDKLPRTPSGKIILGELP
jgi:acyl-CoA synthetase (AMP-forming)/AMP-acid ligase II